MNRSFKAIVIEESGEGKFIASMRDRLISDLPDNDVLVKVSWSGLNYKDALSASGNKGITRKYPHTPGIDAAGIVVSSKSGLFNEGEEVIITGYDLGMNTSGGFAEYINVPSQWVVKRPKGISLQESMIIGTSGFTAASGIFEFIEHGIKPESGEILVTGATGAVGSMAVAMLSKAGYQVVAASGKAEAEEWLIKQGATRIIGRKEVDDNSGKGLLPGKWAAVLDTVGGNILSTAIRSTKDRGIITTCGMIASNMLNVSVFPFILRAVKLIGIASAETPMERRLEIWNLIQSLRPDSLTDITRTINLDDTPNELQMMLQGKQTGKVLVRI
jgi:acrylyl-CoA reductase (NADPH)